MNGSLQLPPKAPWWLALVLAAASGAASWAGGQQMGSPSNELLEEIRRIDNRLRDANSRIYDRLADIQERVSRIEGRLQK